MAVFYAKIFPDFSMEDFYSYAKLFEIEWKLGFTSKNLLEMDVIGETAEVDVADIQRVLAIAVGK